MNRPVFNLGARLQSCADLVRKNKCLADVGTDHAYLPIWLMKQNRIKAAIALDINEGPLASARENIEKYQLSGKITARLSDGLVELLPDEADDIVIAGMGGDLIFNIISKAAWLKDGHYNLILQPMTGADELRANLYALGFGLKKEQASRENQKIYSAFSAVYTGKMEKLEGVARYMGKLQPGDKLSRLYAEKQINSLTKKAGGCRHTGALKEEALLRAICAKIRASYIDVSIDTAMTESDSTDEMDYKR